MGETPETLWKAWRNARDARAFEALVRPHLRFALDLARRSGVSAADAEDVVQESLVVLAREKGDGPVRAGVRAWLGRVVRIQAHTQRRSSARRARRERASGMATRGGSGGDIEAREQVEEALARLEPGEREAVVLRYLHDLDYTEIAFVLKASENACRIRVHRALERLRSALGGGAAALVAALGLPAARAEAAVVKGAVAGAGAAPVAAGGVLLMTTTTKALAAAVVGSAVTAVAFLGTGLAGSDRSPARSSATATGHPRGALPEAVAPDRLDATPDEMAFLRTALVKERARRDDARIRPEDTGLDILRRVVESGADVTDLLWDYDRARSHVRPRTGPVARIEATGDVTTVDLPKAAGARVLEFGPGTFLLGGIPTDVESLEIRGAGMDETTVVAGGCTILHVSGNLVHLRVADLTFDGGEGEDQLLDVRGKAAAAIENVRFRRWTATAGYSAPVGIMGGAFVLFRGCEFLGGFASSPGGVAVAMRGDGVAAFDHCLFADLNPVLMGWSGAASRSVVQMDECVFENSPVADSRLLYRERPEFAVRVRGGRVAFGTPDLPEDERTKRWGAAYAAEVTGTEFVPGIARCTLGDLFDVLERFHPADGSMIGGIYAATWRSGGTDEFWIVPVDREGRTGTTLLVRLQDGVVKEIPRARRSRPSNVHRPELATRGRPLYDVLRASGLPRDLGCAQADYAYEWIDDDNRPVVQVGEATPKIVLDPQTGKRLRLP